jgi:chromosome segregation ATPase
MNTNSIDGAKGPRTLDQARWRISELEEQLNLRGPGQSEIVGLKAQIVNLTAKLSASESEIRELKVQLSAYRNRPVAQASALDPSSMTRGQLEQGISAANKLGDTVTVGRLYKELQTRPRCC